jgi:hypothetical protein
MKNNKKVYCCHCRWNHDYWTDNTCLITFSKTEDDFYSPKGRKSQFLATMSRANANNDCRYYKRTWWKIWV